MALNREDTVVDTVASGYTLWCNTASIMKSDYFYFILIVTAKEEENGCEKMGKLSKWFIYSTHMFLTGLSTNRTQRHQRLATASMYALRRR